MYAPYSRFHHSYPRKIGILDSIFYCIAVFSKRRYDRNQRVIKKNLKKIIHRNSDIKKKKYARKNKWRNTKTTTKRNLNDQQYKRIVSYAKKINNDDNEFCKTSLLQFDQRIVDANQMLYGGSMQTWSVHRYSVRCCVLFEWQLKFLIGTGAKNKRNSWKLCSAIRSR